MPRIRITSRWITRLGRFAAGLTFVSLLTWAQSPSVSSVVNGGDYSTNFCPGALAQIYGSNFGSSAKGVSATVAGKPALVIGVAPTVIEIQVPFEAGIGATNLVLTVGGTTLQPFPMTLAATAPSLSTVDASGSGPIAIANAAGAVLVSEAPAKPGDTVTLYVLGLGATKPPTATSSTPTPGSVPVATPTVTIGGQTAKIVVAVTTLYPGLYQINFTIPAGVQGDAPIVVTAGGNSTKSANAQRPLTVPIFGISYIANNASFAGQGTTTPGTIVSLFGNGFGSTSQSTGFPGTTAQGVSVMFNGTPAPIFHLTVTPPSKGSATVPPSLGASQIDLLVPYELPTTGVVQVTVKTPSGTSPNYALNMSPGTPGMYYVQDPSKNTRTNILAQFNNTAWLNMPASMATALQQLLNSTFPGVCQTSFSALSTCGQPAAPGDILVLYATGLGLATPNGDPAGKPLTTGNVAPSDGSVLYETVATPTITVGGLAAKVLFSGITPGLTGEYQIDFQVPDGVTGDDVPVTFSISGSAPDTRTMSIQPKQQ